ncbi:CARDB domain-containing protein [Oryzobacter sp. R7]|uniref:CARDB domain-containing protein n=1 Tax=Oryzobacter faecalis TaxID=3388656 RepID=UPI00398C9CE4
MRAVTGRQVIGSSAPRRVRWVGAVTAVVLALLGTPFLVPAAVADPASPLTVTNAASPSPVASGAEITYTITIVNTGGAKVTNAVLTDQLNGVGTLQSPPATPQYALTSTQGTCTQSGQLVTCNGGTINGGASWTVTIRGVVTAPSGTTLNNTATVTGTKSAQNFTTNGSVQTLVQGGSGSLLPDLTLNKTGPSTVVADAAFDYVLTVNNIGTALANDIVVRDTLPADVTLQASPFEVTSLFTCSSNAPTNPITVTCTGGRVNAGQNGSIRLHVVAPATGPLTNTAVVDPENTIAEGNELNNSSAVVNTSVTSTPAPNGLSIVKTDDPAVIAGAGPDPVSPGQALTYKVRVTNTATTRADDVVVVDGTQGLEAASIVATQVVVNGQVGTGNGCVVAAPEVRCRIKSLNAGGTLTVTVTGTVVAPSGTVLVNTATATANIRNTGVRVTATERTTVKPQFDLTLTKAGQPDPVCARSWPSGTPDVCVGGLLYTFVVGNSGIADATGVVVRDVLPAGVVFDSLVPGSAFTCDPVTPGNVLTCRADISAESTETFSIIVVPPPATGPLTNAVVVDPSNAVFESDETNNDATTTVQVSTGIDLTVFKQDEAGDTPIDPPGTLIPDYPSPSEGFDPIATNGTQTYTVRVDNLGTQDAANVRVEDTLPAGTRFLSATSTEGFTCSHDGAALGGKVTCVGGSLKGTAREFYPLFPGGPQGNQFATIVIKVFATGFVQPVMHNEVRVDPLGAIAEADEDNNVAVQDTVVATGGAGSGAFNQLTVQKAQTSPPAGSAVATNGILRYTITAGNDGSDPVSNVVLQDFLPSGSRFVSAFDTDAGPGTTDAFFCTHDGAATGGVVTCTGGDFSGTVNTIPDTGAPPPATIPLTRQVQVTVFAPNTPGSYQNTVKIDPNDVVPEGNEFDNTAQVTTSVRTAGDGGQNSFHQLRIDKTATASVSTSSVITYTLEVRNAGTNPAFGVSVRDVLPAGTVFISATDDAPGSNQFTCSQAGGTVTCTGATLSGTDVSASGAPQVRTITIRAFAPTQPGTITNTAFVDPDNTIPEGDETDNHDSANTTVTVGAGYIDLQVTKCDQAVTDGCTTDVNTYPSGSTIAYRLEVRNAGTDPAFQVVVRDALPAGLEFISAQDVLGGDGAFLCGESGGVVTCTGGTLDGSSDLIPPLPTTRTVEIIVRAPQVQSQSYTNQAAVDPSNAIPESNETNNTSRDTLTVTSPYNLTIEKDGPTNAQQNSTQDYVLTVTNALAAVDDVVVVDYLPVGLFPLGVEADGNFACTTTENPVNLVRCVGDMAAGATATITVHVFVTQDGGTLDNEACVDPDDDIVETNEADNCRTKSTAVTTLRPNISVLKSASTGSVSIGATLTYTLNVTNTGDAPSAAFDVTDDLPGEVSIVGNPTATDGLATCSHDGSATGGLVTCSLANGLLPGQSTQVTITTSVNDSATTAFTNTAEANGGGAVGESTTEEPCASNPAGCGPELTVTNNTDSVTTSVGGASIDLAVGDITDVPDPVAEGNEVTYTTVVVNGGTQDARAADGNEVVVRVDLPTTGMTLNSVLASQGLACAVSNGGALATCTGDLLAGQSTTITVEMTVGAAAPNRLTVTVTADALDLITETDETNNTQTEVTTVTHTQCQSCIDLQVGQVIAAPNPVANGGDVTYKFTVTNIGDLPAVPVAPDQLVVSVDLDTAFNELDLVSVEATGGFTCAANPDWPLDQTLPEVLCTGPVGGLLPGAGTTVTLVGTADTAVEPSFVAFDVVADPGDVFPEPVEANNTGGLIVDVVAP